MGQYRIYLLHGNITITMEGNNPYRHVQDNLRDAFDDLLADESVYVPQREAEELFNLPDCVHIFFISASGKVSTFSEPSTLRIFKFKDQSSEDKESQTFIQVAGWTHPLIKGASPVLEAGNGAFMFPDAYSEDEGSAVGIVIADDSVFNTDGQAQVQLGQILEELISALKKEEPEINEHRLGKIGLTVFKTAQKVGRTVETKLVPQGTNLIEYVSEQQKAKIVEAEKDAKINCQRSCLRHESNSQSEWFCGKQTRKIKQKTS